MAAERYTPIDWYDSGRPKMYRDALTGETLSVYQWRKRRAEEPVDDTDDDAPLLDTVAEPEAPPPPRKTRPAEPLVEDSPQRHMSGLAEAFAPGIATFTYTLLSLWWRGTPRAYFAPPSEVTTPMLVPIGRIADRHLLARFKLENTADGRDLLQLMAATASAGAWFWQAMGEYEQATQEQSGYSAAYERPQRPQPQQYQQQPSPAADAGREMGDRPPEVDSFGGDWAAAIIRRAGENAWQNAPVGDGDNGSAANSATPGSQGAPLDASRAVSQLRQLYALDNLGRRNRGLRGGLG
jgi:hypothetical protein